MTRRLVLMAILSIPLCGCYGLWDTNQTLIQFVTGTKIEVVKAPTYAEDRDTPRRRKVIVKTKAEAEAEKKAGKKGEKGDDEIAMLKAAQERSDRKGDAPAEPKPAEQKPADKPVDKPAEKAPEKPAEKPAEQTLSVDKKQAESTSAPAKPHYPEQKAPPAVPRPAVKIDASADAPAGAAKPMIPLPSPAKSIPQGATPAERSWQAKTAKRDKKAAQQQEQKQGKPAEAKPADTKPAEPAQSTTADAPKPS